MPRALLPPVCLLFASAPASAQYDAEAPEPLPIPRATIVLAGGGPLSVEAREQFFVWGGRDAMALIVAPSARTAEVVEESFRAWYEVVPHGQVSAMVADPKVPASSGSYARLRDVDAVWLEGADADSWTRLLADPEVRGELDDLLARGGVLGAHDGAAAALGLVDPPLTPGIVFEPEVELEGRRDALLTTLEREPTRVGLAVEHGGGLALRGRWIQPLGDSVGTAIVAAGGGRPLREETITRQRPGELLRLTRSAAARAERPWPRAEQPAPEVPSGSLVLVGGGGVPASVLRAFVDRAGGAEGLVLYVPCTSDLEIAETPGFARTLERAGAGRVVVLHTKDRARADGDEHLLGLLREADGIWFGGGRQWNFVDSYLHTEAHRLMHGVLERGGVIGGSSAGASIQASYLARGDTLGNRDIVAEGYEEGLGFLPGVAVDQHFTQRGRHPDMRELVETYPQLLGIGIDESTAVWVEGTTARVEGRGGVYFFDGPGEPVRVADGGTYSLARESSDDAPYTVVLGVAQDAGYPQAACLRECCAPVWDDPAARRHVACLGIVDPASGERWMIEATPDFREQLRMLDELAPPTGSPGLAGVLLTHAHIGHYTGLQFLGHESIGARGVPVHAMPRMREFLSSNGPWDQLVEYGNIALVPLEDGATVALNERLAVTPVRVLHREEYTEVVGYRIDGPERSVLFLPDIDKWDRWESWDVRPGRIEDELARVDVAYLDGTFYAEGELPHRDMASIPHPFIAESIERFAPLAEAERAKVRFLHLNHTNPALRPGTGAVEAIEAAGHHVAEEGERVRL